MKGRYLEVLLAALAAGAAVSVQAADIRPVVHVAAEFGGDTLADVTFTDGSTQKVRAHQGVALGGGASWINDARDIEVQVTLSYKFAMIDANNGDIEWTRMPLDALVFYRWQKFRLGGGLTYHLNPKLEGSGVAGGLNIKFDNAIGVIAQGDWLITPQFSLGVRYTNLEYEAKAPARGTAKADGFGVTLGYRF